MVYELKFCGQRITLRWSHLSLLLVPLTLALTFAYEDKQGMFYVPFVCGICALIIFINFPNLVVFLHSKPIYYDDLIMKNYEGEGHIYNEDFRKKYQNIFRWIISISSSIMVAFAVELWFFRDSLFKSHAEGESQSARDKAANILAVLGIIGGLFRMYYGAAMMVGRLLLFVLKKMKKREQERRRQDTEDRTLVELTSIGVTIAGEDVEPLLHKSSSYGDIRASGTSTFMTDIFNE